MCILPQNFHKAWLYSISNDVKNPQTTELRDMLEVMTYATFH